MDAPKCRNIPSCGKRHYGDCASASSQTPRAKKPAGQKKKSKKPVLRVVESESDLVGRVVVLEAMVAELIEARKKRSIYMKNYMRDYRERGG